MGDIFGAVGGVASSVISANAAKKAAQTQAAALKEARDFVYTQLDPNVIGGQATTADVQRLKDRLALQAITDPSLSGLRYSTQNALAQEQAGIGNGVSQVVANQAAQEALASGKSTNDLRTRLIDSAMQELNAGATLPPDVQAELVKAGLEKSGMVTGAASPRGIGGTLLRREIGSGALKLQADRQARAAALAATASQLDAQRQQILGNLYPNLQASQLKDVAANQAILSQSNQMVPEAGLGGTDIANLWLGRVGATNQLNQSAADVAARGTVAQGNAYAQGIGSAANLAGSLWNNAPAAYNTVSGWFSQPQAASGGNLSDALAYV